MPKLKKKNHIAMASAQLPSDPLRAYRKGHSEGFDDALKSILNVVVFCMMDLEIVDLDELEIFYEKFYRTIEMMDEGNLTLQEIKQILKRDYGCMVKVK